MFHQVVRTKRSCLLWGEWTTYVLWLQKDTFVVLPIFPLKKVLRSASTLSFDASVLCFEVNLNDLLRKSSIASSGGTTLNNMERQQQPMIIAASLVAAVSVVWYINSKSKKMSTAKKCPKDSTIGSRGVVALSTPVPYINKFFLCLQDPCDPDTNRKGHVALCVAENKLITDLLAQRLMHSGTSSEAFSDSRVYCYSSFIGLPVAREAVAYFLARRFLYPGDPSLTPAAALEAISPLNVALGSGAAALLNYLFFILGEDGDVCLIPAPYYSAFDNDMSVIAGCRPFAVAQTNPTLGPSEQDLQLAYDKARSVRFSRPLCKELNNMDINHSLFVHSKVYGSNFCCSPTQIILVLSFIALMSFETRLHGLENINYKSLWMKYMHFQLTKNKTMALNL